MYMNNKLTRENAIVFLKEITSVISLRRLMPALDNANATGLSRSTAYRLIDGTRSMGGQAHGPRRFDSLATTAREYGLSLTVTTGGGEMFDITDNDVISDMYEAVRAECDKMTGIVFSDLTAFSNATHHSLVYGERVSSLTVAMIYSAIVEPLYF